MFDLTQTIQNVNSASDPGFIAITICLILTIVGFKLFSFFEERAKYGYLSEKTASLGMDLSSIATIIFAIGFFASIIFIHAPKNAAIIEPAPEVQSWAKKRYGVEMTQEQAEDILRASDLDGTLTDASGTLIVTIDGEERLITWNFVGQSKLMLSDTNLNELPIITT